MSTKYTGDEIVNKVIEDHIIRTEHGLRKYGVSLSDNPSGIRARLQHAYEEALDLAAYLRWAIEWFERDIQPKSAVRRCQGGDVRPDGSCIACFAAKDEKCLSPAAQT